MTLLLEQGSRYCTKELQLEHPPPPSWNSLEQNYTVCKPEHGYTVYLHYHYWVSGVKDVFPFKLRQQNIYNTQSIISTI